MAITKEPETIIKPSEDESLSTSSAPQNFILNTNKAGMEGLDTEKINEIIKNASEGSLFYIRKQKQQQDLDIKLEQMKKEATKFTEEQIRNATLQMDAMIKKLEAGCDLTRTIVHVDMDMFYAAVEMRDDPSLRGKPMAVGSTQMLSTSNYAARRYGVRAAMPGFIGKKLCPDLIIIPPHFEKYKEVSQQVRQVFAEYDPNFCPMSLDEAYLDITEYLRVNGHKYNESDEMDIVYMTTSVVTEMRKKIFNMTQLTASAGIAPNTRLAKVCSDMNKPNGQYYLHPDQEEIQKFLSSLPIRKVSGIGNVTEQYLQALGITHCSQLLEKKGLLKLLFSDTSTHTFMNVALGLGHTNLATWTEREQKSISVETTFKGTENKGFLLKVIEDLSQELAIEMKQKNIIGKVITLKLKTTDFQIRSRAQTLPEATCNPEILISTAHSLLLREINFSSKPLSFRLIGVRMSSLVTAAELGPIRQATLTQIFSRKSQSGPSMKHVSNSLPRDKNNANDSSSKLLEIYQDKEKSVVKLHVDEKKNSQVKKQNIPITIFFSKPNEHPIIERSNCYECAVCGQQIEVKNLEEFNIHLDACLNSCTSSEQSKATISNEEYDISVMNEHHDENTIENYGHTNDDDKDSDYTKVSTDKSMFSGIHSSKKDYICPVCNLRQFCDIGTLNKHLDECLSKDVISHIQNDKSKQSRQTGKCFFIKEPQQWLEGKPCSSQALENGKRKDITNDTVKKNKKKKETNNTLDRYFT